MTRRISGVILLVFFVFVMVRPSHGWTQAVSLSQDMTREAIYSQYQRYKLSAKNDYSAVIDKRTIVDLATRNPSWSVAQLQYELEKHRADRGKLIQNRIGGAKVPGTIRDVGNMAVGLSSIAVGALATPVAGAVVGVVGKTTLDRGVSIYENWASPEVRTQAAQQLYDAHRQGQLFIDEVNAAARTLRVRNQRARAVLDQIDRESIGIDMGTSVSAITTQDIAFAAILQNVHILKALHSDGSLAIGVDELVALGRQSAVDVRELVQHSRTGQANELLRQEREQKYAAIESATYILGTLLGRTATTQSLGQQVIAFGNAGVAMSRAVDRFNAATNSGGQYGSLILTADLIGIGFALANAFSKEPSPDQIIIEQLEALHLFLEDFYKAVQQRFDRVDLQLNTIWKSLTEHYARTGFEADVAADSLVGLNRDLFATYERIGRAEARLMAAMSNMLTLRVQERVDRIVLAQRLPSVSKLTRDAISISSFAANALNGQPFVYVDRVSNMPDAELIGALSGAASARAARESTDLEDLGAAVNLVDQLLRNNDQLRSPQLANPTAWVFVARQYQRLLNHLGGIVAQRIPRTATQQLAEPAEQLQSALDGLLGRAGEAAEAKKGQAVLARLLSDYEGAALELARRLEEERPAFSAANARGVSFWLSLNEALEEEAARTFFSPINIALPLCDGFRAEHFLGTLRHFPLHFPAESYRWIDPAFRLAARLGGPNIVLCHYTRLDLWGSGYLRFAVSAQVDGLSVMSRALDAKDEPGGDAARTLDTASLWDQRYKARFATEAQEDTWEQYQKLADDPNARGTHKWLKYCAPLGKRPTPGSPEAANCDAWRRDLSVPWRTGVANHFEVIASAGYERDELRQRIIDVVIVPAMLNARRSYAAFVLQRLSSNPALGEQARKLTLKKQTLIATLSLAYAGQMANSDQLRASFFGSEQLFDEASLKKFFENDVSDGGRVLTIETEMARRISAARKTLADTGPQEGIRSVDTVLATVLQHHASVP